MILSHFVINEMLVSLFDCSNRSLYYIFLLGFQEISQLAISFRSKILFLA